MNEPLDAYLDSLDAAYADDSEERFRKQFCATIDCDNCGKTFLKSTMHKWPDENWDGICLACGSVPGLYETEECFCSIYIWGEDKLYCINCVTQLADDWGPEERPYNWGYEGQGH